MQKTKSDKKRKRLIIAAIAVAFILVFDLSPLGGNILFYSKWANCGKQPVQVASSPGHAWYEPTPLYAPLRTKVLYCSPLEAEQAGYSASPYQQEFRYLPKNQ